MVRRQVGLALCSNGLGGALASTSSWKGKCAFLSNNVTVDDLEMTEKNNRKQPQLITRLLVCDLELFHKVGNRTLKTTLQR